MGEESYRARQSEELDTEEQEGFWHAVWQRLCSGEQFETAKPALACSMYCLQQPVKRDCCLQSGTVLMGSSPACWVWTSPSMSGLCESTNTSSGRRLACGMVGLRERGPVHSKPPAHR